MRAEGPAHGESPFPSLMALGLGPGVSTAPSGHAKSKRGDLASAEEGEKMIRDLIEEEFVSVGTALWK